MKRLVIIFAALFFAFGCSESTKDGGSGSSNGGGDNGNPSTSDFKLNENGDLERGGLVFIKAKGEFENPVLELSSDNNYDYSDGSGAVFYIINKSNESYMYKILDQIFVPFGKDVVTCYGGPFRKFGEEDKAKLAPYINDSYNVESSTGIGASLSPKEYVGMSLNCKLASNYIGNTAAPTNMTVTLKPFETQDLDLDVPFHINFKISKTLEIVTEPKDIDFGAVKSGETKTIEVTIHNFGNGYGPDAPDRAYSLLNENVSFSDNNFALSDIGLGADGQVVYPLNGKVNGYAKVELNFTPTTIGNHEGTAKFCDRTHTNLCFEIPLKGEGIN